jgi:hypothetical protein
MADAELQTWQEWQLGGVHVGGISYARLSVGADGMCCAI